MKIGPYSIDTIVTGDARELAKAIPDESVDMTLTSPPYDNLRSYKGYVFDFEAIARQLYRVTKPGCVVVWIVADQTIDGSESGTSFRQALYFMECGFNLHDTMIYEVAGTGAKGSNLAYWQAFEYMFILSKGRPKAVNRIADVKNRRAGVMVTRGRKTNEVGTRLGDYIVPDVGIRSNIWRYHTGMNGDEKTDHPAPFPESLARDHILSWSNPGDLILDPMCGSGTTCKMAKLYNRRYIGFDISEEYVTIARKRLSATSQPFPGMVGDQGLYVSEY